MIDACLKVDFAPEQTFVDISNWGVKEIGIITRGKELPFTGHFDFAGVMLKSSKSASGVFQNIGANGIVENVKCNFTDSRLAHTNSGKIQNIQSRNTYTTAASNTGGVLSQNKGTVIGSVVWAESAILLRYDSYGGIAHSNAGVISNCSFYGANTNSELSTFGGISSIIYSTATIVGDVLNFTKGIISDCKVYMPMTKEVIVKGEYVGGILGNGHYGGKIENCTANISFSRLTTDTTGGAYIGGIAGFMRAPGIIDNCVASGEIKNQDSSIGGIVGDLMPSNDATFENGSVRASNCISNVNVSGRHSVGGIVGRLQSATDFSLSFTVSDCENRGTVSGSTSVGGIVGSVDTKTSKVKIQHSTNYGDVTVSTARGGGLVGDFYNSGGTIEGCKNYGNILGAGVQKGGLIGNGGDNTANGIVAFKDCYSYATKIDVGTDCSLAGYLSTGDTLTACYVRNISGKDAWFLGGVVKGEVANQLTFLASNTSTDKPAPEVMLSVNCDLITKDVNYIMTFNTDIIPEGTKIDMLKISVDGGSYFTQLIHNKYVLCRIDTAAIASNITIGKGAGEYKKLTFIYNADTTVEKCKILVRLSNPGMNYQREFYL